MRLPRPCRETIARRDKSEVTYEGTFRQGDSPSFSQKRPTRPRADGTGSTSPSGPRRNGACRPVTTPAGRWIRPDPQRPARRSRGARHRRGHRPRAPCRPRACSGGSTSATRGAVRPGSGAARSRSRCRRRAGSPLRFEVDVRSRLRCAPRPGGPRAPRWLRRPCRPTIRRSAARFRRQPAGAGLRGPAVDSLVGEVREVERAFVDREVAPTVLVYPRARVEGPRRHVLDASVRCPAHDDVAPALAGTALQPVHVFAARRYLREAYRAADDHARGDRGPPRTVGGDCPFGQSSTPPRWSASQHLSRSASRSLKC